MEEDLVLICLIHKQTSQELSGPSQGALLDIYSYLSQTASMSAKRYVNPKIAKLL